MKYGIIGVGAIASAIVKGLCEKSEEPPFIILSPRNNAIATGLASRYPTVHVGKDNQAVLDDAAVILLCIRPPDAEAVTRELAFSERHVVLSAMAGIRIATLERLVAPSRVIARTIPLPAVANRNGITAVYPPNSEAKKLFELLGGTMPVDDETAFDALSASTATIAAYFAYINSISVWLASKNIPEGAAFSYVASMFAGLAETLKGEQGFDRLILDHSTPGGTNEAFLKNLREAGIYDVVERGLQLIHERLTSASTD